MKITGTIYSYSFLCDRKVWFAYHNINRENDNENVSIGALLDVNSYKRYEHNIHIDDICIDYLNKNIVYEIKKSDKQNQMAINQVKYYLYTLYKKGLKNVKGCINYPLQNKKEEVILTDEDIKFIERRLEKIEKIISMPKPPNALNESFCKNCAYFDMCFI